MTTNTPSPKLPYTHGIEIENYLVEDNGETIIGEKLLTVWDEMFIRATEFLKKNLTKKGVPREIKKKIKKIYVAEEIKREKKLKFIFVNYQLGKKTIKVNVFGPDPNISQITWLLELVTPPCESLSELEWWLRTLFSAAEYGLKGNSAKLMTIGINPFEKDYKSGLSCGIHHHIGIKDVNLRLESYNMIRNFIPHIIALTSTSPFLNSVPSGKIVIKEDLAGNSYKKVITRDCIHSYRLLFNTGQMGPNIPEYLPIIIPNRKIGKKEFAELVKKPAPNDRMVDLYPFTDYDTVEIRIFDAHPFIKLHLATVILIQALVMKTKKLLTNKLNIPYVDSKSIFENRNKAIKYGFLGNFNRDPKLDKNFDSIYNTDTQNNKKASKLIQSYTSLIIYLREEIELLGSKEQLSLLLTPIFGDKNNNLLPPISLVDFFLFKYQNTNKNDINLLLPLFTYNEKFKLQLEPNGTLEDLIVTSLEEKDNLMDESKISTIKEKNTLSNRLKSDLKSKLAKTKETSEEKRIKKVVTRKTKKKQKILSSSKSKPETARIDKSKVKRKTKVKTEKAVTEKEKEKEYKKSAKAAISSKTKEKLPIKEIKTKEMEKKIKKPATKPSKKDKKVVTSDLEAKMDLSEKITSATSQEIEVLTPIIPIDPKYGTYSSKIASAMRERRIEREKRRKKEILLRQEKEKFPFKPSLKSIKYIFPKKIVGNGVFGNIGIKWPKGSHYKLNKNPVTIFSTIKSGSKSKRYKFTTNMDINFIKKGFSNIPVFIELSSFEGLVNITLEGRTATNEVLFEKDIKITRLPKKEGVFIKENDFYITGRYGQVEMVFKGSAKAKKNTKGKIRLFIASQGTETEIFSTNYNLKDKQIIELAETIELHPTLHHGLFWIVAKISDGKLASYEAIKVDPIEKEIVSWDFESVKGHPDLKDGLEPKKRYLLNFHLQFNNFLPPTTQVTLFATTFPEGRTIKLSTARITKEINKGDSFVLEKIQIKMPKKIGYLYFSCDLITSTGLLSQEFITEPIGVQRRL